MFRAAGGISPADIERVERAGQAQAHRGPDDAGLFHDTHAALAHRRLSIIDLSPSGRQPMSNEDGTIWIVFNGEIYNFQSLQQELAPRHFFRSRSDTEAIVHGYEEWGIEILLSRLQGMFALAIYDARNAQPRLILARDRLGIKPLYYHLRPDGGLAFASEVKALLKGGLAGNEPDLRAISGFLLLGSIPSPLTSVRHVSCLMPGQYLEAERGWLHRREYWNIAHETTRAAGASPEQRLESALRDSVKRHLVGDVPVGIFLSGGVDSAALVTVASRLHSRLSTLTVVFDEPGFNEGEAARAVAHRFGAEHAEIRITSDDFMATVPEMLRAMDQPTNDGLNTLIVSKAARQAGLKVVLSGLGGDELFWGYRHYRWLSDHRGSLRFLAGAPAPMRDLLLRTAVAVGKIRGRERLMRLSVLQGGVTDEGLYLALRGFYAAGQVGKLLDLGSKELRSHLDGHRLALRPENANGVPSCEAFNWIELRRYMHDQLLRDTDVFSMSQSIEVRVPFLDAAVVSEALAMAPERKLERGVNKPSLVRAVHEDLVSAAGRRKKKGFSFPLDNWMKSHSSDLKELAVRSPLVNRKEAARLWSAFEANRLHWSRAWALVALGAASDTYAWKS
jgi:asparagine synthase (glutamine-hydrolysing)